MLIVVKNQFSFQRRLFNIGVIYYVLQKSSEWFEVRDMDGLSLTIPFSFHDNFLALNEICWGLERFSVSGLSPESREKLLLSTKSVEVMDGVTHTSIQGDLIVSFSNGRIYVRKFFDNTVVISILEESGHVKFDLSTDVFYKETFHPFTLDSTEEPEKPDTALITARSKRKCLQYCSIQ